MRLQWTGCGRCRDSSGSLQCETERFSLFRPNLPIFLREALALSSITAVPVRTHRQKKQFLELPWKIYREDPLWVPPLRSNQKELVNYKYHPFYDDAEIETFLGVLDGEVVGRIAAILCHGHNRLHPTEQRGFVGFFESVNDQSVANGLFDAARDWFSKRGIDELRGPMNPSMNYECGLLVENFDMPPTFMMTYNARYYPQLWESYGFVKAQDLLTFTGLKQDIETMEKKIAYVAEGAIERFGIRVRPLRRRKFMEDVRTFLDIYNKSLVGNWGHIPMSDKEVNHTAASLRFLLVPHLTIIAEVDGKPVGSMLGLLDYNRRIRGMDGRLFPFGFLQLLTRRSEIKRLRLVSTNVLPEYQRWGVGIVLGNSILKPALDFGMEEGEFSWVLESNHLSRRTLERANIAVEKVHRIYDLLATA